MSKLIPIGARVLAKDLEPEVSLVKRAQAAGLHMVVLPENEPKPTTAKVVAVGSDPLVQEHINVGDIVFFNRHAGFEVIIEGETYRSLELREISHVLKPSLEEPTPRGQAPSSEQEQAATVDPKIEPRQH